MSRNGSRPTRCRAQDTVGKLLNHGGRSVTARYIKTSYLGRMLAAAQEDISPHLVKALGSPHGMA